MGSLGCWGTVYTPHKWDRGDSVEAEGGASPASFSMGGARPSPPSVLLSVASSSAPPEDDYVATYTRTGADDEANLSSFAERRTHSPTSPTHGSSSYSS